MGRRKLKPRERPRPRTGRGPLKTLEHELHAPTGTRSEVFAGIIDRHARHARPGKLLYCGFDEVVFPDHDAAMRSRDELQAALGIEGLHATTCDRKQDGHAHLTGLRELIEAAR